MAGKSAPSWKQKRAMPRPGAADLKKRRLWATLALVASLVFIGWYIYSQLNIYTPKTYILVVGKSVDEALSLPPVRYVQSTWDHLVQLTQKATHIKVDDFSRSKAYRFGGSSEESSFYSKIESMIPELKRNDALIVWINGTGITVNDQPMIVGDLFSPRNFANSDGRNNLVDVAEVLKAMSHWSGPKLLLVDWGQELFDPRINLLENRFASKLSDVVQAHEATNKSPVCVLVSHYDGQISLVDSSASEKQSLFSRAVKEGLLLQERRMPDAPDADFVVPKGTTNLSARNLIEYVVRRVRADSFGYQQPAVYLSGQGLLEKIEGRTLADVGILALDSRYRLPKGFPKPVTDAEASDASTKDEEQKEGKSEAESDLPDVAAQPQAVQELHKMWTAIERLRTPDSNQHNWSYAALSPLAYKQLVASAMDIELRYYASNRASVDPSGLELEGLPPLLYQVAPEPAGNIQAGQRDEFKRNYEHLQSTRQWACIQYELNQLAATLNSLNLTELSAARGQLSALQDASAWSDWSAGRQRLATFVQTSIKRIKQLAIDNNTGRAAAAAELLLRSNLLSADERLTLRKLQETTLKLVDDRSDLDKNRALTGPKSQTQPSGWSLELARLNESLIEQVASDKPVAIDSIIETIGRLDPRDVRDALSNSTSSAVKRIKSAVEHPNLAAPPQQELWDIAWEDPTILSDQLKLDGTHETKLLLRASHANMPFPRVRLDVSDNVLVFINDNQWDLQMPLAENLFARSQAGKERRLAIKLVAKESDTASSTLSRLRVMTEESDKIGQLPKPLSIYIPVENPIRLTFHQQFIKDGRLDWHEQRLPLQPFSGRDSKFQIRVKNIDHQPHHVEVRLYAIADESPGRVGWVHRSVDGRQLAAREPDLVWDEDIPGNITQAKDALVVKLAPPSVPQPAGTTPKAAAPATPPPPPDPAAGKLSILGGMMVMVLVDHKATPQIQQPINFTPRQAKDLIDAEVQLNRDKTLKVTARWKDGDVRDNRAAIAPPDLDKKPLLINWDSLPWRQGNSSVPALSLTLKNDSTAPEERTSVPLSGRDKDVWLDIDGSPRAMVFRLQGDTDKPVKTLDENPRVAWRSVSNIVDGKPVLQYVPFKPPAAKKDMAAMIGGNAAVFKDLTGEVRIELAVDLPAAASGSADDDSDQRFLVRFGTNSITQLRPRKTTAELKSVSDHCVVSWSERDQVVQFDCSQDNATGDSQYRLSVEGSALSKDMLDVVVISDVEPPRLREAKVAPAVVTQGSNETVTLTLRVEDRTGQVTVQAISAPGKTAPPLLDMPRSGENKIEVPISTGALLPGKYTLRITLADAFGHTDNYATNASFEVKALPPPPPPGSDKGGAPELIGTFKVTALLPTKRPVRNPVAFKVEPPPEKQKQLDDGTLEIKDAKAGSYKVTATYSERSIKYAGEKTIVIAKPEDFKKLWEVPLAPKE